MSNWLSDHHLTGHCYAHLELIFFIIPNYNSMESISQNQQPVTSQSTKSILSPTEMKAITGGSGTATEIIIIQDIINE